MRHWEVRVRGERTREASRRFELELGAVSSVTEREDPWLGNRRFEEEERGEVKPLVRVGRRRPHADPSAHLVCGLGLRVWGVGCGVQGAGCRVQGAGCRVQGAGCRV